jgi:hypothetical protein
MKAASAVSLTALRPWLPLRPPSAPATSGTDRPPAQEESVKARLTRLAYSLATLVALVAALGAGTKWR